MRTHPDEPHTLAAAYVLGSLPTQEHDGFEAHLEECATCADEVAELQQVLLGLSAAHEHSPPAGLRDAILTAADDPATTTPSGDVVELRPDRRPATRPWVVRMTAVAAGILAIAVAGLGLIVAELNDRLEGSEQVAQAARQDAERYATLLAAPDARIATAETADGVSARLLYSATRDEALIATDRLQPAADQRTYQLWVIDDDGPSSAGTFDTDPDGQAVVELAGDLEAGVTIGITDEPAGGSDQPTTDPVLAIVLD